jgi:hypothetical protein
MRTDVPLRGGETVAGGEAGLLSQPLFQDAADV